MAGPTVRPIEDDELDRYFDVRAQAFGMSESGRAEWRTFIDAAPEAPRLGAFAGDGGLLGALRVLPAGQFLLGGRVAMGGIGGVVVRPEARGRGVAGALLRAALDWMRENGIAASSLHPASTRVYRSVGWEIAGAAGHVGVPSRSLAGLRGDAGLAVERLGPADREARQRCYVAGAIAMHGALDRSGTFWSMHERADAEDGAYVYGVREGEELRGYVAYTQLPGTHWGYSVRVDDIWACDRATAVALWRFLGAHSMQVELVQIPLFARRGLLLLLDEQDVVEPRENRWMHRIVDLPAYLSARGVAGEAAAAVTVEVTDPWSGGVSGTWRIEVDGGRATAAPAPSATVRCDVGALSALLVGGASVGELVTAGRLGGEAGDLARLGALAAAPTPWITDDF